MTRIISFVVAAAVLATAALSGQSGRGGQGTPASDVADARTLLDRLTRTEFATLGAMAQADRPFEVTSIRQNTGPMGRMSSRVAGRNFEAVNATPFELIARAHRIEELGRVVAPDWTKRERFDIRAVLPEGAMERDVPEMLRALLVTRFSLQTHTERREFPVYELVVDSSGPRFQEVAPADDLRTTFSSSADAPIGSERISGLPGDEVRVVTRGVGSRRVTARTMYDRNFLPGGTGASELDATRITMREFIDEIEPSVDRPVIDKTGLEGVYQFKTLIPPRAVSPAMQALLGDRLSKDPSGVSMTRSLQQLGLRLEPRSAPVDFVVVDRIDRPTPD